MADREPTERTLIVALRLLDTNIVSYLFKKHPFGQLYLQHLVGHIPAISFMTFAELEEWALMRRWGSARSTALATFLRRYAIFHSDDDICRAWGVVRHQRRSQPISTADAWIAATALVNGADLVTHNPRDFCGISGLSIITEAP